MNKGFNQNNMNMPNMSNNMSNMPRENEDHLYPEVHQRFAPIVDQLISDMERQYGEIYLTEDLLNQMIEELHRRSGMDNMPASSYDTQDEEAIQTMHEIGRHGGRDRGRDRWRRYDRSALSDIFGILILQQLFGRRRPRWRWR